MKILIQPLASTLKRVAVALNQFSQHIQSFIESEEALAEEPDGRSPATPPFQAGADIPVLIWGTNTDAECIYFNQTWLAFTGRSLEQELGNGWAEDVHPDDLQRCMKTFRSAFAARQPFSMQYRLRHISGEYRWILDNGIPQFSENSEFTGYVGTCVDITDLKLAEVTLRQSQEQNQAILSAIPDIMAIVDADGMYLSCSYNRFAGELIPLENMNPVGMRLTDVLQPEFANRWLMAIQRALSTGEMQVHEQQQWFGDRIQYEEVRIVPYRENLALCLVRDISDRKRVEDEYQRAEVSLRQSETKQAALISALPDLVMRISRNGVYLDFLTTSAFKVIGDRAALVGTRVDESLPPELAQRRMNAIQAALQTGELQVYEQEIVIDGEIQTEECRVVVCGDDEVLIIGRDITDRKQAEAQLESQNALLARVARGESLSNILNALIAQVEQNLQGTLCSILLIDGENQLRHGAAQSLPETYIQALGNVPIADGSGSCGTAAFRKQPIIVSDIASDQLWDNFRDLALAHELRSCWSTPIIASVGQVLGTFAVYYREVRSPKSHELKVLAQLANIAGIALEREQAEAKIRQSEEQLQLTLEFTGIGAWSWIPATGEYHWNGKMLELLELPPGLENMFQIWRDRIHPDDVDRVEASLQHALTTGTAFAEEYRYCFPDQRVVWRWVKGQGIYAETGEVERVLGVVQDIDERKQTELTLQKTTEELDRFFSAALDLLCIANTDGYFLRLNPVWERTLGYSLDELKSRRFLDFLHPEDLDNTLAAIATLADKKEILNFVNRYRHQDGSYRWIEWRAIPVGHLIYASARDITERKQAEDALRQSEAKNRAMLAAIPDLLLRIKQDGTCLDFIPPSIPPETNFLPVQFNVTEVLPPELWQHQQQRMAQAQETGSLQVWDQQISRDGTLCEEEVRLVYCGNDEFLIIVRDITQRKKAEAVLRESEEKFRQLTEHIRDAFFICTPNLDRYLYVSPAIERIWGITAEQLYQNSLSWLNLIHPDDYDYFVANTPIGAIETDYDLEYRIQRPDGETRWVHIRAYPVRDDQNQIDRLVGVCEDITERKQTELALQESQAIQTAIIQAIPDLMIRMDQSGQYRGFMSSQYVNVIFPDKPIEESNVYDFLPVPLAEQRLHSTRLALETGLPQMYEQTLEIDGQPCYEEVRLVPLFEQEVLTIVRDVTDRKQAEIALREKQQQLTSLLNNIPHIAWLKDWDGRFLAVNEPFAQACGYDSAQLVGLTDLDVWPAHLAEAYRQDDREVMESRQQKRVEEPLLSATGEDRWLETIKTPILNDRGESTGTAGIAMDITERKRTERALHQLNEELEQRVQERTQALTRSEQDLRTIFNNVYDAILIHDMDGTVLDANDRAMELRGATRDQLLAATIAEMSAPDAPIERLPEILQRVQAGETLRFEWRERRFDDNSTYDVEVSLRQVTLGNRPVFIAGVRDISDRKQAERNLRESQQFIQTVLDTVPLPMFWKDRNSLFLGCNQQLAQLMGLASTSEIIGKTGFEFSITASEVTAYIADDQQVMNSGVAKLGIEETFTQPNGEQRWIETHKAPLRDWAGDVVGIVGMFQDITARKQAERALQESERRYATLATAAPVAIFRFDTAWNCTYVNDHWSGMTGRPKESALGQGWLDALHPDDRDRLLAKAAQQAPSDPQDLDSGEGRHILPDGSINWFYVQVAPEIDADGSLVGFIGTLTDITIRKQIEFELAESEAKFRRLVEGSNVLVWSFDQNGRFTYLSPQFKTLFGWEPNEWLGRSFLDLAHPDDHPVLNKDYQENLILGQPSKHPEFRHLHRDGHYLWVSSSAMPIFNSEGNMVGAQGIVADISDRKQAEAALRESESRLAERNAILQSVIASTPDVVFVKDQEGRIILANSSFASFFEQPVEALIGKNDAELWSPEMARQLHELDLQIMATGIAETLEESVPHLNGTRTYLTTKSPWYDAQGNVLGTVGLSRDISDRKQAEIALLESQRFLQTVIDTFPLVVFWKDRQSVYLGCNSKSAAVAGLSSPAEIIGKTDYDMPWGATEAEAYRADDREVMESGKAKLGIIETQVRADGAKVWIETNKLPLYNLNGELIGILGTYQDITDRKQAEEALQEERLRLQLALNAAQMGTWSCSLQTGKLIWSDLAQEIFGFIPGTFPGDRETFLALVHPDDRDRVVQAIIHTFETGAPYNIEYRIYRLDGALRWIAVWGIILQELPVSDKHLIGVVCDITDRKQAEQDLRESRNMLELVLDTIPQRVFWKDRHSRFLGCNSAFANDYRMTYEEIVGKTDLELPWAEWAHLYRADDAGVIETRTSKLNYEEPTVNLYGEQIWIRSSKIPLTNSEGEVIGILGCYDDITDRKQAEQQLQAERLRLQLALEAANMGTWESNMETGIWSERTEAIFGYAPGTFPGDREAFLKLVHVDDQERVFGALAHSFSTQSPYSVEYRINRLDGEVRWVAVNGKVVANDDGSNLRIVGVALDITDRKQAEQALRDSEERLRLALNAASQGLYDLNVQTGEAIVSPEYATMLGYDPATFQETNAKWIERLHPDDMEVVAAVYRAYTAGEIPEYKVEFRQRTPDGQWKWILSLGKIVTYDEAGQPLRMLGTHTDIHERKQAEAQLREQEQFLRSIYEGVSQPIFVTDVLPDNSVRVVGWNPVATALLGKTSEEVAGKTIPEIFPAAEASEILSRYEQCITTKQACTFEECLFLDGETRWTLSTYNPLLDRDGRVYRIVGRAFDITDRKRAEEELRQAVTTNQALLNAIPDLILLITRDGIYRDGIPTPNMSLLLSQTELVGKSLWEVLPGNLAQQRMHAIEQAFQTGSPQIHEYEISIDGELRYEEARCVVCRDDEAMVLVRDITDRKQAEVAFQQLTLESAAALQQLNLELEQRVIERTLELQQAMEDAETANRAKSTFLANMSHELRTPLNAILGFAQLMSRDMTLDSEKRQQLSIINRSGNHLLNLINDVLEMSKIEAGRVYFAPNCFDFHSLLDTLAAMFQVRASEKGLQLVVDLAPDLPRYLETDENKLRQVLINLVNNAIKFTQTGSVTLRVMLGNGSASAAQREINSSQINTAFPIELAFEVQDTGVGISQTELESLFEPFIQSKNRQVNQEGTGLGLAISRQFVTLMGGILTVSSTPGVGSTFAFAIPVELANPVDLSTPTSLRHILGLAPAQPSYRVLVVEDNETNRLLLLQLLRSVGFEVQTANNGQEAIGLWQTWQPHLIWMDMRMPVMDGYEATKQIRLQESLIIDHPSSVESSGLMTQNKGQKTIIIALTANAFEEDRDRVLAIGCDDFIRKPFQETELLEKMAEYLGVQYLYQEEGQPEAIAPVAFDAIAALQTLPTSLLEQLYQATLQLDSQQLTELITQIATVQPLLAELLTEKLENFDLEQILRLLQQAMV